MGGKGRGRAVDSTGEVTVGVILTQVCDKMAGNREGKGERESCQWCKRDELVVMVTQVC